jgi:hypothetical protein
MLAALNHSERRRDPRPRGAERRPLPRHGARRGRDARRAARRGPLPSTRRSTSAADRGGLEAAHAAGIVHRGPQAVEREDPAGGGVKVLDLGLARSVESSRPSISSLSPTSRRPRRATASSSARPPT